MAVLFFLLVVLPVFFALRRTRLWLPWLAIASYFFYGWWNPYYLFLVVYSTVLDYFLVTFMDQCPRGGAAVLASARGCGGKTWPCRGADVPPRRWVCGWRG